jgi:hypothetical protein
LLLAESPGVDLLMSGADRYCRLDVRRALSLRSARVAVIAIEGSTAHGV